MNMLKAKIESILFIAARPLSIAKLSEICGAKKDEVADAVEEISERYESAKAGIRIVRHGDSVQMATAQETADLVRDFMKDETTGELTKPSLETLTIVAYRGPLTKAEIEQVRGVNCSMILRNLMMRGLVESMGEHGNPLTQYRVTMDFLRFLGLSSVEELPDYDTLRSSENVRRVLEESKESNEAEEDATKEEDVAAEPAPAPSRGPDSASEEESEEKEPAEAN